MPWLLLDYLQKLVFLKYENPSWMFIFQNIFLLSSNNMCIYLGGIYGAVPKQLLNISHINIRIQEAGCKCVPEHMRCDMNINTGKRSILI